MMGNVDERDRGGVELEPLQITSDQHREETYYAVETFSNDVVSVGAKVDPATSSRQSLDDFFFPPALPKEVQLLRWENVAIPACYLVVGTMQGMFRPLLNVWPLDLGATEAQQTTLSMIATLPAAFKVLYGFWSDNLPIAGYRRKPYMLCGWLLCSCIMAIFMLASDTTISHPARNANSNGNADFTKDPPSIQWMSVCFFLFGNGLWLADVMADSLVAQKARCELEGLRGNLQSTCYANRFFGLMVAAPVSTYLYSSVGPAAVVSVLMTTPLLMVPLIYLLHEDTNTVILSTRDQCTEIWKTVCMRSVWQPMAFIYLFNLLQVPNVAWRQFLSTNLHFTEADLNTLLVMSYVLLYAGTMTYKYCFLQSSWRRLYQVCIVLNGILSSLQLLLIRGRTTHPFWFALGDDAFSEFLAGIQFFASIDSHGELVSNRKRGGIVCHVYYGMEFGHDVGSCHCHALIGDLGCS